MNIQEFSHQLGQKDHPSRLIRALRALRGQDMDRLRQMRRVGGGDWGIWTGGEPQDGAKQPALP